MSKDPKEYAANDIGLSDQHVVRFLEGNPDFFKRHPDLISMLTPPERSLGDAVVDFQHFQLKNLQHNAKQLEHKYHGLVDFCRDNLSAQSEVHEAVLRMVRTDGLEQLLEVLAVDLPALFDLDVVRLAVESPLAREQMQDLEGMMQSGILLVENGVIDTALLGKDIRLVDDSAAEDANGVDEIFVNAESLSRSYALLRLTLERVDYPVVLAFGVRHAGRFHAGQGMDLLIFLARVLAIQMDRYLTDLTG
jgi:uncharacterized protein YigA (DUF484 family)